MSDYNPTNQGGSYYTSGEPTQPMAGAPEAPTSYTERYGQPQAAPQHVASTGNTATASARPQVKQKSGSGRSFAFGFLGALLACALAFGGFGLWQGAGSASDSAATDNQRNVTLGGSSSTSITAGQDDPSLAEQVAAKALPSVVCIYAYVDQASYYGYYGSTSSSDLVASSLGSGIVLSEDGYVLTNNHVVEGADALKVNIGGDEVDATFVGSDPSSDLAVIKIDNAEGLVAAELGDSDNLTVGEWVMTIGSPFGLEQSVATGVVSATSRSQIYNDTSSSQYYGTSSSVTIYPNMIQTDAAINPGNSGGALVNSQGQVIGVNTLITSYSGNYSGVGFAIPINYAMGIAQQIIEGKTPTHARLGVSVTTVNAQLARRHNLPTDSGAFISTVSAGSGAEAAGLQEGDIIVKLADDKITSATDVTLSVREHNPGDTVQVVVNRNGETVTLDVTLGSDEEDLNMPVSNGQENGNGGGMGRDELWYYLFGGN